jgi:carboxypeptidase family protein
MRLRISAIVAALALAVFAASAWAQAPTGEIFGKVTDSSGAVLPGVTVTVTGPSLLQPLVATSSESGSFQFPRLEVGSYNVKFELPGFKTVVKQDIRITVGFSADLSTAMAVSNVQETVTVTGESPIVDTRETGTKQTFGLEQLQQIPSARDPWVILQQTAGIAMDRENIGGNMSGQQSNFVSRGANPFNTKWSLNGVDVTDMAATGASPTYYDFDAFQEMTITTGGVDVTQQTGGVGVNLITKSGTDKFRGSGRFFDTNDTFQSNNVTDAQRQQGATSGNPIQDIQDYGVEAGGPIKRGRAWIWGAYGKQDVGVGVIGFYQPTPQCQAFKDPATALAASINDVNNCLNTDHTLLETTNLKGEVQLFKGNKLTLYNMFSKKVRNARGASDLNPIETTNLQDAVPSQYGAWGWRTGPTPTYQFGDQWVISDRLLAEVEYSHVGNNFILDFHDPSLATVQPSFIVSSGLNGRSGSASVNIRPVNSVNFNGNYFMPASFFGDHAFKFGGYWRDAYSETINLFGGDATARFPTQAAYDNDTCTEGVSAGCAVTLFRQGDTPDRLTNIAVFAQDTITHGKTTVQVGVRYDYNHDVALAANIPANTILPDLLPAVSFGGVDPGIKFNNFSPRVGLTYDLTGNGRTVLRANYARYYGQVGNGGVAGQVNPLGSVSVRYPWVDLNGDRIVQANEIMPTNGNFANFQAISGNWNPLNPTAVTTANTIDPNLKNDTTDEFIVGATRDLGHGVAVDLNYIHRYYSNFSSAFTLNPDGSLVTSDQYTSTTYTPTCTVAGARCDAVTTYYPITQLGNVTELINTPNFNRKFNGVELGARKRLAHRWMMNGSFTWNSTIQNYGQGSYQNPNNIDVRNGFQYDFLTSGSGIGNVFVNAKWLAKLSGMYQAPYAFNVSAFYNARQGYPFEAAVQVLTALPNGGGTPTMILDPIGQNRLPTYQNLDLRVERPITIMGAHLVPSMDIFNITNNNIVQALRGNQNANNANNIQAIVAPRVIRFGVRVNW